MKSLIYVAFITGFALWLLGSIVAWDINPGNWEPLGRYMLVILWIPFGLVVFSENQQIHNEE